MAAEWLDWLTRATLASSAAILLVLLLRPLWRRGLGSGSVLWLWLMLPAALLAASLPRPTLVVDRVVDLAAMQAIAPPVATAAAMDPAPGWPSVAVALWLSGALLLGVRLVLQQRAFRRRLGALRRRDDGVFVAGTACLGPAVIGAWRPRIVVPADFEQRYDPRQRLLVLAHERCHLRRGDLQVNLLLSALRCLFWFNPLVHVAAARLQLDQELACDASVLARHPDAGRTYAQALLNTQLADLGLPVGCHWQSSHPLQWRIAMLKQPSPGFVRLLCGAALAMLASSAAAATVWQALPVHTVVLPVVSPARALPPLSTQGAVRAALPALPTLAVALGTLPEEAPAGQAPPQQAAEPIDAPLPAPAAVTTQSPTASADASPPRVVEVWLADLPTGLRGGERPRDRNGSVVVEVEVDAEGRPQGAVVAYTDLGQRYQANALRAVKRWKFEPAQRDGEAVASTVLVAVPFDREFTQDGYWGDGVQHQVAAMAPGTRAGR